MLLSDKDLAGVLRDRRLDVEPYDPELLQPTSPDVRTWPTRRNEKTDA